ncbi:hypothetical protein [Clavibacter sp.]|uniref:hypothetical protein n=1 Tax=Clavibacter sp. TaxID=1871044 RepID=UPI0019958D22|nr:hypothetical protein [Clavibacter sp.]MBD5381934.1 hypothetical protein [Clavibacter sp.]
MISKEQQDLLWAIIPKDIKDNIKKIYTAHTKRQNITSQDTLLDNLFGRENLESDTEPEEMLMVSKKQVLTELCRAANLQNDKEEDWIRAGEEIEFTLTQLFGDKCLPDKELGHGLEQTVQESVQVESKPKFKVGQPVRVLAERAFGRIEKIETYDEEDNTYRLEYLPDFWFEPSDLEPYTEESRNLSQSLSNCDKPNDKQLKDNMEEKELDLYELLQDCSDVTTIYSVVHDAEVEFKLANRNIEFMGLSFYSNGSMYDVAGRCMLYPSRALYEKYPLDAYSAWQEWKESRKPKYILQAQLRLISIDGKTIEDYENVEVETSEIDLTKAEEAVRESLEKFHSKVAQSK